MSQSVAVKSDRRTEVQTKVNQALTEYLSASTAHASLTSPGFESLLRTLLVVTQSGGKRMRPYLAVLAYEAFAEPNDAAIMPIATALELLHISMLIHDDIIDRDDIRHGVLNMSGIYKQVYSEYIRDPAQAQHFSNAAAMLAGDFMLSGSYQMVLESNLPATAKLTAQRLIGEAVTQVIGGELMDTEASFRPFAEVDPLLIASAKTAGYSFVSPLTIGATLGGAEAQTITLLRAYGEALGVAFQLIDDLLGVFGESKLTGKTVDGDIREGKKTYLIQQTIERAPESRDRLLSMLGKPDLSESDMVWVRNCIEDSGARTAVEQLIATYAKQAYDALTSIETMHDDARAELEQLIESVQTRKF